MSDGLRFRKTWAGIGLAMIATVIAASLLAVTAPPGAPGVDKVYHLVAYGGLMFWWGMVQPARRRTWAVVLIGLGIGLELAQSLTAYRSMDAWDALANTAGVALALGLLLTPAARLLHWFDRQLGDRLDPGPV